MVRQGEDTMIKIITKRIDEVVAGEIIRGSVINGWSEVISVDVDEEYPATEIKVYRPATNGGIVDPIQRGRGTQRKLLLPSFDLVEVQVRVAA
jgi:hypothetical protein